MATINGTIVIGTEVLVENIPIWIEVFFEQGQRKSWSGSFTLPERHNFTFDSQEKYEVQLVDGRRGQLIPTHFDGSTVSFQGTGPLE